MCLAALSVEDIEDIYLFGTMITGIMLIGLGFALGYRRIQKTGTAVQSLTRLPVMFEAVGRAVSIETETINRNMDSITEKLTALQRKIDGRRSEWTKRVAVELECGYSPQDKTNRNLIFSAPLYQHWPWPWPLLENQPWEEHCSETLCVPPPFYRHLLITHTHILITNYYTYTHIYMHSLPHPRSLASVALNRQPDKRVCD